MALDSVQYKSVFDLHYEALYGYACSMLKAETYVDDILQNIFIKLWQSKEKIKPETVKSYLYTSVRNECLNHIKHKGVQATYAQTTMMAGSTSDHNNQTEQKELHEKIQYLVNQLPEKCAAVFYLCRQSGFSYKEVAEALDISVKTVENQMSKALKFLRSGLSEYLVSWLPLFILHLINL
ncbi:RNA polymerase sigma-70 factor [Niabella ginsengisoli]|uniref:RNA polymerase sigma-70 factor n=1 Tax=Niabella ginsengisoli TaxID=522298 RepID=A0ABS9SMK0_9BACT|nr:RNA polymerase sigma-70 factor [Niabella ginsengisoli]MCH5599585.1 RNA polymerase sigma-70 factor [Niabella ginsengisoli]